MDEAERRFRAALELAPSYVEAMSNLGGVAAVRGDAAGAEAWYERAIAVDPSYPHVHRRLADLFYDRHDWARALAYYRRVLAALPTPFEVLVQAGNAARFLGDDAAARDYYAAAGRVRADSWIPPYNLACLAALAGDAGGALALLGEAADLGLAAPPLLDDNDDFASLRATPEWTQLAARVQTAAIVRPRRS
ncbi:MAG: tetratricopeptide repeat protein [bacterium]|nr:tetratricopeptide repeat protein [bacterium]